MATIDIYDLTGSKVGTLELADEVFGAVNEDLLVTTVAVPVTLVHRRGVANDTGLHRKSESGSADPVCKSVQTHGRFPFTA